MFFENNMFGLGFGFGFLMIFDDVEVMLFVLINVYLWGGVVSIYFWIDFV